MLGMGVEGKGSFWFAAAPGKKQTDYDQLGVNHIGVRADEQRDVDTVAKFLSGHGVAARFGTPRHRPEFAEGEGQTYYQVMFTSPDNSCSRWSTSDRRPASFVRAPSLAARLRELGVADPAFPTRGGSG